jgi:hypothetical protein
MVWLKDETMIFLFFYRRVAKNWSLTEVGGPVVRGRGSWLSAVVEIGLALITNF